MSAAGDVRIPMVSQRDSSKGVLDSVHSAANGSTVIFTSAAKYEAQAGEFQVWSDGMVLFNPLEVNPPTASTCFCAPSPLPHFPAIDVIGASVATGSQSLILWHCPPRGSTKISRTLKSSKPFTFDDAAVALEACSAVRKAAVHLGRSKAGAPEAAAAPAALKVFGIVNPKSGQGKSAAVAKDVKETLSHAGIQLTFWATTRAGEASDLVKAHLTREFSAIAVFGGDGTVHEIVQGLMLCEDSAALLDIPLCNVPAGSGNGLAASCGLWSVDSAAHAIIKGATSRLDGATLFQPTRRKRLTIFHSVGFGLISCIDIGTEPLRKVLGKERFTYGAVKEIIRNNTHTAHVAWVPEAELESVLRNAESAAAAAAPVAAAGKGPPTPILDQLGVSPPAMTDPTAWPAGWTHLDTDTLSIFNVSNIQWAASDFKLTPMANHSDGLWEIMLGRKLTRFEGLDMLLKAADGKHEGAKYLDVQRVGAFAIQPVSNSTWLTADGEVIEYDTTFVEVHKGLLCVVVAPSE